MTTGILASGQLGLTVIEQSFDLLRPLFIATDSNSTGIIEYAEKNKIPLFKGNPRGGKLTQFLNESNISCELIYSVNYLFLIEKDLIDYPKFAINFHGSLLPKYRGRTPHVWAIINNEKEAGVTAHLIDESCDTGDVILQHKIQIGKDSTGAEVLLEFQAVYPGLLMEVHKLFLSGEYQLNKQDDSKATFFGKRTPEDGQINWEWSKERIRNWVRAQAMPYPGAFTFLEGEKVIIDKVEYSDLGFHQEITNGTVLTVEGEIIVKVANGALALTKIRNENLSVEVNQCFK